MLKNILDLEKVHPLTKEEQKTINGSAPVGCMNPNLIGIDPEGGSPSICNDGYYYQTQIKKCCPRGGGGPIQV